MKQRWSGRFGGPVDSRALDFTQSVEFDKKLYYYDILGSMAYARALARARLLTRREQNRILKGLASVTRDIDGGRFRFRQELEDVHRNIEAALQKKIGPTGGKLHTGRSRNDQVAVAFRLYCRDRLAELHDSLLALERAFLKKAKEGVDVILPGYTHLQRAQPVLLAHHWLAYIEMWERDRSRILECFHRLNVCPLGAGALAGNAFPIDREYLARQLGFRAVAHNSLDAVSDRDFAIEIASVSSLLMMHLSRLCEELILWSSSEFGFIRLPESFCTGSSMMPQKMNPDVAELIRGKTGRVYGHLLSLLTVMKSLPLAYNKDLQEDKEAVFDLFETVINCVDLLAAMAVKMEPNRERMREAASDGSLYATDLADWLVKKGTDFRAAHEVVSRIVRNARHRGREIDRLSLRELQKFSPKFDASIFSLFNPKSSLNQRKVVGGTARECVLREIRRLEKKIS